MTQANLKTTFPQNYIIKNPLIGAIILFAFSFGFTILYHPLNAHRSFYFDFELTMLVYTLCSSIVGGLSIMLIKRLPFFSKVEKWTLGKELISIYIIIQMMGVAIYLMAFAIEEPAVASRWNFATFFDSCKGAFLIYIIPFAFFSAMNYKFLFLNFESTIDNFQDNQQQELTVNIRSKLKKESLTFHANELLFAVSEGNYVIFHLIKETGIKKAPIRNAISDIESQLKHIPFYFRCHRGFIVNLNKIESKKGNASGYLLKIKNSPDVIPVSRKNAADLNQLMTSSRV